MLFLRNEGEAVSAVTVPMTDELVRGVLAEKP
jgi:hypothetical protein